MASRGIGASGSAWPGAMTLFKLGASERPANADESNTDEKCVAVERG